MGSVRAGISAARELGAEAVVVGLADQPEITPEAWRRVAAATTPIAVAQTRRVHFARNLIQESNLPMARIALAAVPLAALLGACGNNLGSSDPYVFMRVHFLRALCRMALGLEAERIMIVTEGYGSSLVEKALHRDGLGPRNRRPQHQAHANKNPHHVHIGDRLPPENLSSSGCLRTEPRKNAIRPRFSQAARPG